MNGTTLAPQSFQTAGIEFDLDQEIRFNAKMALDQLEEAQEEIEDNADFKSIIQLIRAQVIDSAYQGKTINVDLDLLLKIHGPNDSHLNYEVFRPSGITSCPPDVFEKRTHLKIGRTLLNIKELRKAYGGSQLKDLADQLSTYLNSNSSVGVLRQRLVAVTKSTNFSAYLQHKQDFLDQWIGEKDITKGEPDATPLVDNDLSKTMKALLQQKPILEEKPQVLRYTDYRFFRLFNSTSHHEMESTNMGFWKTESIRDEFHKLVSALRQKYQVNAPFHVFRFENSFTYLICGFSDESAAQGIIQDQTQAPVHAKIIMRQSNKVYRELQSDDFGNRTLYHNCLKEAMLPFAEQLNRRLNMDLSPSFIDFFRI